MLLRTQLQGFGSVRQSLIRLIWSYGATVRNPIYCLAKQTLHVTGERPPSQSGHATVRTTFNLTKSGALLVTSGTFKQPCWATALTDVSLKIKDYWKIISISAYQHISISAYQHGSNYFPMVDWRKRSTGIGIFPFRPFKAVVLEKAANYECTEDVQTKFAQASWSRVLCLHCILCSRALFKFNPPRLQKASYVKAGSSLIAHAYWLSTRACLGVNHGRMEPS
jgi:hypothetical protein